MVSLKEKFKIDLDYVNEEDIIEINDKKYGDTYRYRRPIELPDHPGFYLVPGIVRFAYKPFGDVYDMELDKIIHVRHIEQEISNGTSYFIRKFALFHNWPQMSVKDRPKHIGAIISEQRLFMLIFSEYTNHPKRMRVMFRNHDFLDIRLENLFWVSKESPIAVLNVITRAKQHYESFAQAALEHNSSIGSIHNQAKRRSSIPTKEGVIFRFMDDVDEVPELNELEKRWVLHPDRQPLHLAGCQILDSDQQEVFFGTYRRGAEYLGVPRREFDKYIQQGYGKRHIVNKINFRNID